MSSELQQRLLALVSRAGHLLGSPRMEDVLPGILAVASESLLADGYAVWRLDRARGRWVIASHAGVSETFASGGISTYLGQSAMPMKMQPIVAEDVRATPTLAQRAAAYEQEGIVSILAVPLAVDVDGDGTLVFYWRARRTLASDDVELGAALAHLAGAALRTADLHAEQLRAERQTRFLAEAAGALASSLDYGQTLQTMAQLAVPHIADWCAIDIVDAAGAVELLALSHVDPARVAMARAFATKYPPDPQSPTGTLAVIRTGKPELLPLLTDEMIERGGRSDEHRADVRALGIASFMIVPLRTRRGIVGAMTFVAAESRRSFTPADLRFAETVADRAAVAIDNARAYDEAQRANRVKDEFLATLSHELRTPLNAILGYAQMLRGGAIAAERHEAALEVIERNAQVLTQLVGDILDVSRIVSGKMKLSVQAVELGPLFADALGTVLPAAERRGIRLTSRVAPDLVTVHADPDRLRQVLWNLLTNAVKFTPAGGRVEVNAARVAPDGVELTVIDTGRGISTDFMPFLFERFRQADGPYSREHGGLGLGLSIARNIVEMHGGTIHAESEGDGRGATFRVRLPDPAPSS
ncbi:MAG TPA: ATP-binding protein [Vicinamibacterales bacterium]|jgi:signal transduction histidine kinase